MRLKQHGYPSVAAYLRHALVATGSVVLLPVAVVLSAMAAFQPDPPMLPLAALGRPKHCD